MHGILLGDITKHEHGPYHLAVAVADWRATVGNIALTALAGDEDGVIGQTLDRAMFQRGHDGNGGGLAGFLVDDVENLAHRVTQRFCQSPACELFGHRIEVRHAGAGISGQHGVAD